jgi:hypothetical protein
MPAFTAPACLHTDDIRAVPTDDVALRPSRVLAWLAGASLVAMGTFGLSGDRLLWLFDSSCIMFGALALPPVTDAVREKLPFGVGPRVHFAVAVAALIGALGFNMSDALQGPASYPVSFRGSVDPSFGTVELASESQRVERRAAQKAEYVSLVRDQLAAAEREAALAKDMDIAPTPYDEDMLNTRAEIVARRSSMQLAPDEVVLVNKLAARVSAARAQMAPGLRRAYVEALAGPLSAYGVSARLVNGNVLEFTGPALDDKRRAALVSLTQNERARLGFVDVRFAVPPSGDVNAPTASLHQTSGLPPQAMDGPPA